MSTPTPTLAHVHVTTESVPTLELTPPHPPREETPEYAAAHKFLVHEKKQGCAICGVTIDTLSDAQVNTWGATALETHHWPVERSLVDACDPRKVHADFPSVYDMKTLTAWVDSPANLLVLCDVHHRSVEHGIHHLLPQDWQVQKYLREGYRIVARAQDVAVATVIDNRIEQAAGLETTGEAAASTAPAIESSDKTPSPAPVTPQKARKRSSNIVPRKRATPNGQAKKTAATDQPVPPQASAQGAPAAPRQRAPRRAASGPRRRKAAAPAGAL